MNLGGLRSIFAPLFAAGCGAAQMWETHIRSLPHRLAAAARVDPRCGSSGKPWLEHTLGRIWHRASNSAIYFRRLTIQLPIFFFFPREPGPPQRCVSMLHTESLRKQYFHFILAYEKFGEIASLPARLFRTIWCAAVSKLCR